MTCTTLQCDSRVSVSVDGDTYTFTVTECRYTGPDLIRDFLTKVICQYMLDNSLGLSSASTCCGLPMKITGNQAEIELVYNGILPEGLLLFEGGSLLFNGSYLTYSGT